MSGDGSDDEDTEAFEEDLVEKKEEHEGSDARDNKTKDTKGTKDEDIRGTEDEGSKDEDTGGTEDMAEKVTRLLKHGEEEKKEDEKRINTQPMDIHNQLGVAQVHSALKTRPRSAWT